MESMGFTWHSQTAGPTKAQALMDGRHVSVGDLLRVNGIGPATLEAIRDYVRVN
jgi:DNA uptake protein ComE-like DNA-binding protein